MKVEIFKTNIQTQNQAKEVLKALKSILLNSRINFDLDDCDKILRIENSSVHSKIVISVVESLGFLCKVMPDKICKNTTSSLG